MSCRAFHFRFAPLALAILASAARADAEFAEIGIPNDSYFYGLSADGCVAVGEHDFGTWRAIRWTAAGGVEDLGSLGGVGPNNTSGAWGANRDGSVIVGWVRRADGKDHAFRWTVATDMQSVKAWLAGAGVTVPAAWVLQEATGVDAGVD